MLSPEKIARVSGMASPVVVSTALYVLLGIIATLLSPLVPAARSDQGCDITLPGLPVCTELISDDVLLHVWQAHQSAHLAHGRMLLAHVRCRRVCSFFPPGTCAKPLPSLHTDATTLHSPR